MSQPAGSRSSQTTVLIQALVQTLLEQREAHMDRNGSGERPVAPERVLQAERLILSGELLMSLSHEVNNALQGIIGNLQLLQLEPLPTAAQEMTHHVLRSGEQLKHLLESMLTLARGTPTTQQCDLDQALPMVIDLITPLARERGVTVTADVAPHLAVPLAPFQVQQILLNLLINSIQALDTGRGQIRIVGSARTDTIEIAVQDDGPGIPDPLATQIFEPFFSTKKAGVGTGLGLAIVRSIVQGAGGTISVTDPRPQHTTFTVVLPRVYEQA